MLSYANDTGCLIQSVRHTDPGGDYQPSAKGALRVGSVAATDITQVDTADRVVMTVPVLWQESAVGDSVTPTSVFGEKSYIPYVSKPDGCGISSAGGTGYQIFTLLLLPLYLLLVFRYGSQILQALRIVWGGKGDDGQRGDNDLPGVEVQAVALLCGLTMFGVATVKICELWGGTGPLSLLIVSGGWITVSGVMLALSVIIGIQVIILRAIGALTFSGGFIRMLSVRRISLFVSMAAAGTPPVLAMALSDGVWANVAAVLFTAVITLHIILYAVRSFFLFVEQKVSILLWILYLCVIEAMPAGILIIGLLRSWPV